MPRLSPPKRARPANRSLSFPAFLTPLVIISSSPHPTTTTSKRSSFFSTSPTTLHRIRISPPAPRSTRPSRVTATASPPTQTQDVPEPLLKAIESLSRQPRQTIPDIAAASGLPLDTAQLEAAKLAALTKAPIDVTSAGELAYRFPSNVRQLLRTASFRATLRMTWEKAAPFLFTSVRVAFGALLILSIVVTFVAIAALSASARSDDDRRDRSSSVLPFRLFAPNPLDILWYSRGGYSTNSVPKDPNDMSFLESVYSFVFGDPDPNQTLDSRRYRSIAALIRSNNGAVTGDQLAPFLDPPSAASGVVDETFVLPVLIRFQGRPEVTEQGDIIYVFPDFVRTGSSVPRVEMAGRGSATPLLETERVLSRAAMGQKAMSVVLGVANLLGVLALGSKLLTVIPVTSDAAALVSLIKTIYPALALYATSFFFVPLVRYLRLQSTNASIRERNRARTAAAERLRRGNVDMERKIAGAQAYAQKESVVKSGDVVYSSDLDILEQTGMEDGLKDDFDRRLSDR